METSVRRDLLTGGVPHTAAGARRARGDLAQDLIVRPGAKLVNSRGVLGTLGALAVSHHDQAVVILTSEHVLLGAGAPYGEPVWLTADVVGGPCFLRLGRSCYGRTGTVERGGAVHVDCAIATIDGWSGPPVGWHVRPDVEPDRDPPRAGRVVWLEGAVSGRSHGVVTDSGSGDEAATTPGQFFVRGLEPGRPFSVEGDSGAVVRDRVGSPLGLLWGTTPSGASVVTPIAAVVDVLGLHLMRIVGVNVEHAGDETQAGLPR